MAGAPKKRLAFARLDLHENEIVEAIGSGRSMKVIARAYGNCTRPYIYQWIHAGGSEREVKWETAKESS